MTCKLDNISTELREHIQKLGLLEEDAHGPASILPASTFDTDGLE
jgi:hypothetical protein